MKEYNSELVRTEDVNKWWDGLMHEQKENYIARMNPFNYGRPANVYSITKYQKEELYQQVHNKYGKTLIC